MANGTAIEDNDECAVRLDDLSNQLAQAATEIEEDLIEEARLILEAVSKELAEVKQYLDSKGESGSGEDEND